MKARLSLGIILALLTALTLVAGGCSSGGGGGGGGTATVTGTAVDDGTTARISGAVARADGKASPPTGADGNFTIAGVRTGTRTVTVSAPNHVDQSRAVTVHSGGTTAGTFYLPPVLQAGKGAVTGIAVLAGSLVPVSGAIIEAQAGTVWVEARSHPDGRFTVYNVPAGNAQVTFYDSVSHNSAWQTVQIQDGITKNIGTVQLGNWPPPPPPI